MESLRGAAARLAPSMPPVRVVILPGNGAGNVFAANWYGWLQQRLHKPPAITAVLR